MLSYSELFRQYPLNASEHKTGAPSTGLSVPEYPQQDLFSDSLVSLNIDGFVSTLKSQTSALLGLATQEQTHASTDNVKTIKAARREIWEATGDIPPITGGAHSNSAQPENPEDPSNHQPDANRRGSWIIELKNGLNWREDLSEDGRWLFRCLLLGEEDMNLLPQYAKEDGKNLEAAIKELDSYGILDKNYPGLLRLTKRQIS